MFTIERQNVRVRFCFNFITEVQHLIVLLQADYNIFRRDVIRYTDSYYGNSMGVLSLSKGKAT